MNRVVAFIVFSLWVVVCRACETDDDCSGHGSCQKGKCYCEWFYQGETCSDRWADKNPGWFDFYIFYCIYTCLLNLTIFFVAAQQLWITYPKIRLNVVNLIMFMFELAAAIRVVGFAVDGHNYFRRWPASVQNFMYYTPGLIWFFTFYLMITHWLKLTQNSNLVQLQSFNLINKYTIVMTAVTVVLLLPAIIWESITPIPASVYFLNFTFVFLLISCISLSLYAGRKLYLTLVQALVEGKVFTMLLWKTKWVIAIAFPMFLFTVTVIIFSVINATTHPWAYIILHFLLRTEEFGFVFCGTQVSSKRPVMLGFQIDSVASSSGKENSASSSLKMESVLNYTTS